MGMDITGVVAAVCMSADKCLMPRKICFGISIEGLEQTNNEIRGLQNGYQRGYGTLKKLREMGMKDVGFGMTVQDKNAPDLVPLYKISNEMGMEFATASLHFGYFEVTAFWNAGVILLTGWLLLASKRIREVVQKNATAVLLLFCLAVFIVLNVIYMGTGTYLSYNLIQIVRPIVILCGIFYISQEKNDIIYNFLSANFGLLNLMWVVNLFVLGLQVAGTGFMIKASWMAANSFYADNCTGLFGGSSTHVVMLFTIFITIYNLEFGINRFRAESRCYNYCSV